MNIQLFVPCFVDQIYPKVAFDTIKILKKIGCTVKYNPNQTCCGQPAFNAGYKEEACLVYEKFLKDFDTEDTIVSPSASCVGFLRNYAAQFIPNSKQLKIYELTEFLVNVLKIKDTGSKFYGNATYHSSCAALRECKIINEPLELLKNVEGLNLVELNDKEVCCGFGGTFAVKFAAISVAMGDQKIQNILQTNSEFLISTDMSCLMHLEGIIKKNKLNIQVKHIAEILSNF